jgi:hypothetical protein
LAGATSRVYLVNRDQDARNFALKLMQPNLSPEMQKHFRDEMVNLQRLRVAEEKLGSKHIPRIVESSDLQQPKTQELLELLGNPFIFMDYADGTDVNTILMERNVLNEAEALDIARQFAEVLVVIHGEGLTYTDMKLSNLIWNTKRQHLMVIDWNVIAEGRLAEDAPKDRLQAAAYLFRMVTGIPIELDMARPGVGDQKYRRWESFKSLSAGTQAFLKRAFHPDPSSRHGAGGPPLSSTKEFLKELETHSGRFKFSFSDLISKGQEAKRDRQWQEALEYLDLADRKSDTKIDPAQFAQLQENLGTVRREANKLGRSAFFSGHGRYMTGLFAEALEDFEKAMRDDPYDEEARLFAILTRFARDAGAETFHKFKEPLEECINALLRGHLDLAENALNRLHPHAAEAEAILSLKAEIKVRHAVQNGQRLLKKDQLEDAQNFFRTAYQERDQIFYVEPLEENLGSLTQLYRKVEELKELHREGEILLQEERFREAAGVFFKAKEISQGSHLANLNYQRASTFAAIRRFLESGDVENALERCNRAASRFGDHPNYENLKAQVIEARVQQLRVLADESFQVQHYNSAKEHIVELLKWKPDDEAARIKLQDIQKEIAGGYQEKLEQLEAQIKKAPSIKSCQQAIDEVLEYGFQKFTEGREFLERTEKLKEEIASLNAKLNDFSNLGDLEGQRLVLNEAISKKRLLGTEEPIDPEQLKKELIPKILEKDIDRIQEQLIYCRAEEALKLCKELMDAQLPIEKQSTVQKLMNRANELMGAVKDLEKIRAQKTAFSSESGDDAELVNLKLEKNHLKILQRMKHLEPALKALSEIDEYEEKRTAFLQNLGNVLESTCSQGYSCLSYYDFEGGKKIFSRMNEALSIIKEFEPAVFPGIEKWDNWNREFIDLVDWLEKNTPPLNWSANYHILMSGLANTAKNSRVKEVISMLDRVQLTELETNHKELENLSSLAKDSPLAFWLHRMLAGQIRINRTWKALDEDSSRAEELIDKNIESHERGPYERALETTKEIENFFAGQAQWDNAVQMSLEGLEKLLDQAQNLENQLLGFPRLRGKQKHQHLQDHISKLLNRISQKKTTSINEYEENLETILEKLSQTGEDHVLRLRLEDQARQMIEKLRDLTPKTAEQMERRLEKSLDQLIHISEEELKKYDRFLRLNELQRQVYHIYLEKNTGSVNTYAYLAECKQNPYFKEVIPTYKKRHENLLYKLKRLDGEFTPVRLRSLLKLREEFGEFPELHAAIEETKQQIFQKENQQLLKEIPREIRLARRTDEWAALKKKIEKVDPLLLSDTDQSTYYKMQIEIENQLIIREVPQQENLDRYFKSSDDEYIKKWIRALEWNVKEKKGEFKLAPGISRNLKACEINLFKGKNIGIKALEHLRWVKWLISLQHSQNMMDLNANIGPNTKYKKKI